MKIIYICNDSYILSEGDLAPLTVLTSLYRRRSLGEMLGVLRMLRMLRMVGVSRGRLHDLRANVTDGVISGMLRHLDLILDSSSKDIVFSISSLLKLIRS